MNPFFSVVIPTYNSANKIHRALESVLSQSFDNFEILVMDDGSTDNSQIILHKIFEESDNVIVARLRTNYGKAGALEHGFSLSNGKILVVLDCDLQYEPDDIITLLAEIENGYDVVSGNRINRQDIFSVICASKLHRLSVRAVSSTRFDDYFSGLKCFTREVIQLLDVYGDLNRYLMVYAQHSGFSVKAVVNALAASIAIVTNLSFIPLKNAPMPPPSALTDASKPGKSKTSSI